MTATRVRAAALCMAACLLSGAGLAAARAGEAQDRLFELGVLEGVATGERLVYAHTREGSAADGASLPQVDGQVEIRLVAAEAPARRTAEVALLEGAQLRSLTPFPGDAGNPLLMVFMETSVRSMAAATGGSPFYIRNRMREALRTQDEGAPVAIDADGRTVEARRFAFRPFEGDPNAGKMGPFADLEISFVVSEAVPGRYALLEAVAGPDAQGKPALREAIAYRSTETDR